MPASIIDRRLSSHGGFGTTRNLTARRRGLVFSRAREGKGAGKGLRTPLGRISSSTVFILRRVTFGAITANILRHRRCLEVLAS